MKNLLTLISFLSLAFTSEAQTALLVGGGGIYGDDIQELGIHFRAYYNHKNDRLCFGPEYSLFRAHTENISQDDKMEKRLFEFNLNAHYLFLLGESVAYYPVLGLNYSSEREEEYVMGNREGEQEIVDAFGVNLGSGFHFELSEKVSGYVEFDHLFSKLHQNSFTVGILVGLFPREEVE